jgi:hypothetical protein
MREEAIVATHPEVYPATSDSEKLEMLNKFEMSLNETLKRRPPPTQSDWEQAMKAQCPDDVDKRSDILKCASENGFVMMSTMGTEFQRSAEGKSLEYKSLNTHKDKSNFRSKWATTKYTEHLATKSHRVSWCEVDESKGTYMSISRLIDIEGGRSDQEAVRAAISLASKCMAMGGKFLKWNSMTDRWNFLRYEHTVAETFSKQWELFSEWRSGQPAGVAAVQSGVDVSEAKALDAVTVKNNAGSMTPAAKKRKLASDSTVSPSGPKPKAIKEKGELEKAFGKCSEIKTLHQKAVSMYESVVSSMSDQMWSWASNDQKLVMRADLESKVKAMQNKMTPFAKSFFGNTTQKIRKTFTPDQIITECTHMEELKSLLNDVLHEARGGPVHLSQTQ